MPRITLGVLFLPVLFLCSCMFPLGAELRKHPIVYQAPLQTVPTRIRTLYPHKGSSVTVIVHDTRPHRVAVGYGRSAGSFGSRWRIDRLETLYGVTESGEVAALFEGASKTAAAALGFEQGTDMTIEHSITRFVVDVYQVGGFTPMECIGYGELETSLRSKDGALLRNSVSKVVYWEDAHFFWSGKEVAEAISRIYARAAWESTVGILREQYSSEPDATALSRLLQVARGTGDDAERCEAVFWLGLTGKGNPAVADGLLALFRTSTNRKVAEGASEALGMLSVSGAREEIEAVLSGSRTLPGWHSDNTENVWYLLKALHLLGTPDLEKSISARLKSRIQLNELVLFLNDGTFPELTPEQKQDLEKAIVRLKQEK